MQKAACMLLAAAGAGSYWLLTFFFPLRCFISVRSGGESLFVRSFSIVLNFVIVSLHLCFLTEDSDFLLTRFSGRDETQTSSFWEKQKHPFSVPLACSYTGS